jgi:uncharacterized protein
MARFQILCLSGGGYMGLYSVSVLAALERLSGGPVARRFDLICGTSIGGILALGLAFEVGAEEMLRAFEEDGEKIFPRRRFPLLSSLLKPRHSPEPLRRTVERLIGADSTLGDALHPVLIPTVNVVKGGPQVFKTPHHEDLRTDWDKSATDVAMATSAAPLIFPLAEIGDNLYVDGGLYANSPDLMGIHEAKMFFQEVDESEIHVLSIGTTTRSFSLGHSAGRNLGMVGWGRGVRILRVLMSSQQKLVEHMVQHMLRDRYIRIDADQSEEQSSELGLDHAGQSARRTLRAMAANSMQTISVDPRLKQFLSHDPRPVRFFHGPRAGI